MNKRNMKSWKHKTVTRKKLKQKVEIKQTNCLNKEDGDQEYETVTSWRLKWNKQTFN